GIRIVEEDGPALGGNQGAADERRVAPDRHGRGADRVAHVRVVEQQAGLDALPPHLGLEARQAPGAEARAVDGVHGAHAGVSSGNSRSARIQSQSTAPTPANTVPVTRAAGHPKLRTVNGTRSAPIPPTMLPPVFITPLADDECLPETEMAADQKTASVICWNPRQRARNTTVPTGPAEYAAPRSIAPDNARPTPPKTRCAIRFPRRRETQSQPSP